MLTLSSAALVQGQSFTCTATYCQGTGLLNYGFFRALQLAANTLSKRRGFTDSVTIDGKIGAKTVELIQLLAASTDINTRSPLLAYWKTTKEEVSREAISLTAEMTKLLAGISSSSPAVTLPYPSPSTPPVAAGPATPAVTLPTTTPPGSVVTSSGGGVAPQAGIQVSAMPVLLPQLPSRYVLGGIAAASLLLLGGIAIARRRRAKS